MKLYIWNTTDVINSDVWKERSTFKGTSFASEYDNGDRLKHILTNEPDMVLDTNIKQANVYSHSN